MNHALIGEIAGVLAVVQVIPYIVSIFHGHTKPERATYFIWLIVDAVTITSYIAVGARTTIWTGLVFTVSALLIFILSIRYGMGGFSKFDIICLLLALGGISIWITTGDALLTLYFSTFVTLIGYLPTIKKVYFLPETENTLSWAMCSGASVLNILALTTLRPSIALLPISSAIMEVLIAYLLLFPAARAKVRRHRQPHPVHAFLTHPIFAK